MTGRFDNVDLGVRAALQRMMEKKQSELKSQAKYLANYFNLPESEVLEVLNKHAEQHGE